MTDRTVAIGPASLAVSDTGSGEPCFVFIHGLACDHTAWEPQVADLSRDHRCLNVDLRGRGGSSLTPPYDTTRQADDVAAVLTELGVGPAILVGHSLGGITALLVNERHPDLVLGIVLGDSPVRASMAGLAPMAAGLREANSTEPMRPLLERFWHADTPDELKRYVIEMMLSCPAEVAAGMIEGVPSNMPELVKLADHKPFMAIWAERAIGDA
ncbi:MAG: alpha/beta fold hydrolase, partial [Dehalococcoidia bacterium]